MCANWTDGSDNDGGRLLYSHHKALDDALDAGVLPRRLFRVFYPIWRVQVEGQQRPATDYRELELFLVRAIHEAGISTTASLAEFFGLEPRFVRKLLAFLRSIGHVTGDEGSLALTSLGHESLAAGRRLVEQEMSAVLYFEAIGCRPLTRDYFSVPVYDVLPDDRRFRALSTHFSQWDPAAIPLLMQQPDRQRYGLLDEVERINSIQGRDLAYLAVYIVEQRVSDDMDQPLYLAFSRVKGRRDTILEEAVNLEAQIQVALRPGSDDDLARSVEENLKQVGLDPGDWYLKQNGAWGPQVTVAGDALAREETGGEDRRMGVRDIGRYWLAYDWCVWVTCDDKALCRRAAVEHLLEWLQNVVAMPTADELRQRLALAAERLRIDPIVPDELVHAAGPRGLWRAIERLDVLAVDEDEEE